MPVIERLRTPFHSLEGFGYSSFAGIQKHFRGLEIRAGARPGSSLCESESSAPGGASVLPPLQYPAAETMNTARRTAGKLAASLDERQEAIPVNPLRWNKQLQRLLFNKHRPRVDVCKKRPVPKVLSLFVN
ncbi:hypothetical protein NDU88_003796 [Pleurodeles waltl]|uniref:Uncharacterized protein n=1 Tax=Pleurodeles waltl TaxID=8319 RepID=A0AAV7LI24_PLEWA|nr:hypothetical protein NDU88_003796 [Pleurodeles waltl]